MQQRSRRGRSVLVSAVLATLAALAGCGSTGGTPSPAAPDASSAAGSALSPSSSGAATASGPTPSPVSGGRPTPLVAVTTHGQLVVLDPRTGRVVRTLVGVNAVGDALALSPDGSKVFFESQVGCRNAVLQVPVAGGQAPVMIATDASRPALSPDGTRLAYARQMVNYDRCDAISGSATNGAETYQVVIQDLRSSAKKAYPMDPQAVASGLPAPVGHLSWSPDGSRLMVTITSLQDNEGWQLHQLVPASDRYYLPVDLAGDTPVAHGQPSFAYYREGVYLPDGQLFVARQCCAGIGRPQTPTVQMLKVDPGTGAVSQRVAIGRPTLDHTSLDVDRTGRWLLYLSGSDLLISDGGGTPTTLATGFVAAAW